MARNLSTLRRAMGAANYKAEGLSPADWVERWCGEIKLVVSAAHLEHWASRKVGGQRPSDVDLLHYLSMSTSKRATNWLSPLVSGP